MIDRHYERGKEWPMILDLIHIFRARRDKSLASKLALRFAQGQLLDRAAAPLLIVHLCLWGVAIIVSVISVLVIAAAIKTHWSVGIVGIVPLTIGVSCVWISIRLKKSLDHIRDLAADYSDSHIDRFLNKKQTSLDTASDESLNASPSSNSNSNGCSP